MAYKVTITKKDGSQIIYDLISSSKLKFVDPSRKVLCFFDSGEIFKGCTDGSVDEDFEFSLKARLDDKFSAALPFDRLMGWAYESDGRQKQSSWRKLREYWSQYWWFWLIWCLLLVACIFRL